jgi:hypothetical protein
LWGDGTFDQYLDVLVHYHKAVYVHEGKIKL